MIQIFLNFISLLMKKCFFSCCLIFSNLYFYPNECSFESLPVENSFRFHHQCCWRCTLELWGEGFGMVLIWMSWLDKLRLLQEPKKLAGALMQRDKGGGVWITERWCRRSLIRTTDVCTEEKEQIANRNQNERYSSAFQRRGQISAKVQSDPTYEQP